MFNEKVNAEIIQLSCATKSYMKDFVKKNGRLLKVQIGFRNWYGKTINSISN